MKQFTLQLNTDYQRPVIELKAWHSFEALLDTGAFFPIWTANPNILGKIGGVLERKDVRFGGFGGETSGDLYRLNTFMVGDLIFPNMSIIACADLTAVPFQMILSATMFDNLIYEIDSKNHKLNITVPDDESLVRNLRIKSSSGKLHVLCSGQHGMKGY